MRRTGTLVLPLISKFDSIYLVVGTDRLVVVVQPHCDDTSLINSVFCPLHNDWDFSC